MYIGEEIEKVFQNLIFILKEMVMILPYMMYKQKINQKAGK